MATRAEKAAELLERSAAVVAEVRDHAETVARIAEAVIRVLRGDGALFLCGNGGSAAQCQHAAAELAGRFRLERRGLRAVALTTDTSALTAVGNDYGFEAVFARQLEALARPGDVLVGLSTSGSSANVVRAFEEAKAMGVARIALVGPGGGKAADLADLALHAPGEDTAAVQECHLVVLHAVCHLVEEALSGKEG